MTIDFPPNPSSPGAPTVGQIFTDPGSGNQWQFDGVKWVTLQTPVGVTEVDTGTGLTGGPITSTGTVALADTPVAPGTYQGLTVDQQGRVTAATAQPSVTQVNTGTGLTGGPINTIGTIAMAPSGVTAGTYQGLTVDATGRVTGAATVLPSGAPNKLINPFMEIDQRNEGAALTGAQNGLYVVDGFTFSSGVGAGAWTIARSTDAPPGYPNSLLLTVTATGIVAAGSYSQMIQSIEADELADTGFGTASARTVSVAFYVKSSVTGTYSAVLVNAAGNRSYPFNFTISTAATWQLITQTIPGDTGGTWVVKGNAKGADLRILQVAGTSFQGAANAWGAGALGTPSNSNTFFNTNGATFQLGPCGLWVAPSPQPLLRTSFQAELARCQRYLEKSYDLGTAIGTVTGNGQDFLYAYFPNVPSGVTQGGKGVGFRATKRAAPTLTMYSPSTGASGKVRDSATNADVTPTVSQGLSGFQWYATVAGAGTMVNMVAHWLADAAL